MQELLKINPDVPAYLRYQLRKGLLSESKFEIKAKQALRNLAVKRERERKLLEQEMIHNPHQQQEDEYEAEKADEAARIAFEDSRGLKT